MSKEEIALQLTLKVIEQKEIHFSEYDNSVEGCSDEQLVAQNASKADKIANFYKEIFNSLSTVPTE